MRFLLVIATLLWGCASFGGNYPKDAQRCLTLTREWTAAPQDKSKLDRALGACQEVVKLYGADPKLTGRASLNDLAQLKLSLETAQAALAQGRPADQTYSVTGTIPLDSVRIVIALADRDLQSELQAPPSPSP